MTITDQADIAGELIDWQSLFESEYSTLLKSSGAALAGPENPIIIRLGDDLILNFHSQQHSALINGDKFHWYKRAAHLPVAAGLALKNASAPEEIFTTAETLMTMLDNAPDSEALETIKTALRELLDDVRRHRALRSGALMKFADCCKPATEQLVYKAAETELLALDGAMHDMEKRVGDHSKWLRSYVVICAGHQARYKQLAKQFFHRYFEERPGARGTADHQIIYGEGLTTAADAIDLVATRIADKWIGDVFMGDSRGMQKDVLGDAGTQLLRAGAVDSIKSA